LNNFAQAASNKMGDIKAGVEIAAYQEDKPIMLKWIEAGLDIDTRDPNSILSQAVTGPFGKIKNIRGLIPARKSLNQVNQFIQKGQAPKTITRVDKGLIKGELDHIHFDDGSALNRNGTWKHGEKKLTNQEIKFLQQNGWTLPK
jgi:hypothetical protein